MKNLYLGYLDTLAKHVHFTNTFEFIHINYILLPLREIELAWRKMLTKSNDNYFCQCKFDKHRLTLTTLSGQGVMSLCICSSLCLSMYIYNRFWRIPDTDVTFCVNHHEIIFFRVRMTRFLLSLSKTLSGLARFTWSLPTICSQFAFEVQ